MEKDREDFEKWKKARSLHLEITIRDSNGDYQYLETRRDWYVWWNAIATRQPEIDALKAENERLRKLVDEAHGVVCQYASGFTLLIGEMELALYGEIESEGAMEAHAAMEETK